MHQTYSSAKVPLEGGSLTEPNNRDTGNFSETGAFDLKRPQPDNDDSGKHAPSLRPLDPLQIRLFERLDNKNARLGRIYMGAVQVLTQRDNPNRISLAAHGIRELMEKFPLYADIPIRSETRLGDKVNELCRKWDRAHTANNDEEVYAKRIWDFHEKFDTFVNWRRENVSTRTHQLIETLNAIDASGRPMSQLAENTISQLWRKLRDYFVGISHNSSAVDEVEFGRNFRLVEKFLVERIDPRPCDVCDDIDGLLESVEKTKHPSAEDMENAITLLSKGNTTFDYFFRSNRRPQWIPGLKQRGVFAMHPAAIRDDEGRVFSATRWPPSMYLARMASADPDSFLEIALQIETDNPCIMLDLTEGSLSIPGPQAGKWALKLAKWLKLGGNTLDIMEADVRKLLVKLIADAEPGSCRTLANEILALSYENDSNVAVQNVPESLKSGKGWQTRCSDYHYKEILGTIPALAEVAPLPAIYLLCDLLDTAITFASDDPEKAKPYDLSVISRPAIEDSDQNLAFGLTDHLIVSLRDSAIAACKIAPEKLSEIVEILESHEWNVFRRIALYLLQEINQSSSALIEARLVSEEALNNSRLHHEYYHLLRRRFTELKPESQRQILEWIDRASMARERSLKDHPEMSEQDREEYLDNWRFTKLSALEGQLPSRWTERLKQWQAKRHVREIPPDYLSWTGSWSMGNQSPKTLDELGAMSPDEIVEYLRTWEPSGDWPTPTPDGLGSALGALIEKSPAEHLALCDLLMDETLDPTYTRHAIRGFSKGFQAAEGTLPYEPIFRLFVWVLSRQRKIAGREVPKHLREGLEVDMDWGNARHEMADVFEHIFEKQDLIPYAERERVWGMIRQLTEDPMPDQEHERKYGGRNTDALNMSINTVRGKAMHAVFQYAMWVCRNIQEQVKAKENRKPNLTDLPEVREVLDAHLDVAAPFGRFTTDRAVYGQWLPKLVYLDDEWVRAKLDALFPANPEYKSLCDAAWRSYLLYSGAIYPQVTKLLHPVYAGEVEALQGVAVEDGPAKMPYTRLVEHVVLLFLWGEEPITETSLVGRLFKVAPAELTAHAFDFIGRMLNNEKRDYEPEMLQRLRALWQWRTESVGGYDNMSKEEFATFGWWFSCGLFDSGWAYGELEEVLKRTPISRSNIYVFDRMSEWFTERPAETLRCLRLFIESDNDRWMLHSTRKRKGIWTILEQGMAHPDADIRDESDRLINLLGAKGFLEYRELRKKDE